MAGTFAARTLFAPQTRDEQRWMADAFSAYFEDAMTCARVSSLLALRIPRVRSDLVWLAGMLHDVGRAVTLRSIATLTQGKEKLDPKRVAKVVERVHVEIGGEVHQAWDLPRFATLVAVRHHDLDLPSDGEFRDLHVVRLVSALVQLRRGPVAWEQRRLEVSSSAAVLGLDAFKLRAVDTEIAQALAVPVEDAPKHRVG